ncbi:MAG: alpha-glucan family phosphorylase [Armatimonadetes bacterium]|nr:alpha-glucan family phosphorylase [Gemmatimonadales bacterium]NIO75915.1 alpha-glucan family phosphorylase [Armatimonadota bacterium]
MDIEASVPVPLVAYFSMEICLEPEIPTYSGGLGILAGDTVRAAADLGVPMVAVSLVHRKGYFHQHLDEDGNQSEAPSPWSPEDVLEPVSPHVSVSIDGRTVRAQAWRYPVQGIGGHAVPVYLLDTALAENSEHDKTLTDYLYGGDDHYRLRQEAVLGLGGVCLLRELGITEDVCYHMNEGHSALLALALVEGQMASKGPEAATDEIVEAARQQSIFTTHTPVPAGHDQFPISLVREVLGERRAALLEAAGCCLDGRLNMTHTALRFSRYVNGVSMRHDEVSSGMFPGYPVNAITNGVHAVTWTSPAFQALYDKHVPEWRRDNYYLRYAVGIPLDEIQQAHTGAKKELLAVVKERAGVALDKDTLTIGFARRATGYKRADLLFSDLDRLRSIARRMGPLQAIYAGKAHPRDQEGKNMIRRVFQAAAELGDTAPVVYLEDYDAALARLLCSGVDLWLNTPLPPHEASGTSGMKAALNGIPSLSVLDGWWIEGHVEGVTGWSIGDSVGTSSDSAVEAASLYDKLEQVILPLFCQHPKAYAQIMRNAIAMNGSFFNTQRMMSQYVRNAYPAARG